MDAEPPTPEGVMLADQAVMQSTEAGAHGGPTRTHCQNCGAKLEGPFCHKCGQHDVDFHRSFGHVTLEALENLFHFDAKFFRNIVTLLFRPGRLTAEFNAGKRASQMPPFRLYLFVSVLFFFLFFFGKRAPEQFVYDSPDKKARNEAVDKALDQTMKATQSTPEEIRKAIEKDRKAEERALAKEAVAARKRGTPETVAAIQKRHQTASARWIEDHLKMALEPEHQKEAVREFFHNLPHLLMFCLPWFALYTRVLYRKSGWVYLQHLVLAVHFHTFIYLWLMFRDGWAGLLGTFSPGLGTSLSSVCDLWLIVYPVMMLRTLFGNSWLRTTFKAGFLAMAYLATLISAMVAMALLFFFLV